MEIVSSSICEIGQNRKINQDAIYAYCSEKWGFFAVSDGMGGHEEGERASNEVIGALRMWIEKLPELEQMDTPDIVRQIKKILAKSNDKIKRDTLEGMLCGCTIVVMVLIRRECILLTAGDSRCYELSGEYPNETITQLTVDDVVGGNGPQKNYLTNALGIKKLMHCRSRVLPLHGMHIYLVCTDGVYKYCTDEQILSVLKKVVWNNTDVALSELQDYVEANGARDNYSAFLICVQN